MKKTTQVSLSLLIALMLIPPMALKAQQKDKRSPFSIGADLVSSYVWRGTKFGSGPAIQPYLEVALGNLSIGGWGSYCFSRDESPEADLYISYGFDFGLSVGITDYYFPGTPYFDYSSASGSHGFELNLAYELAGLSIAANYMLNEAGNAGTAGGDIYVELGYSISNFSVFAGGGNGWHSMEDPLDSEEADFSLCNVGISASKEVKFTESFALPMSASLILNPDTEQFHIVVAASF